MPLSLPANAMSMRPIMGVKDVAFECGATIHSTPRQSGAKAENCVRGNTMAQGSPESIYKSSSTLARSRHLPPSLQILLSYRKLIENAIALRNCSSYLPSNSGDVAVCTDHQNKVTCPVWSCSGTISRSIHPKKNSTSSIASVGAAQKSSMLISSPPNMRKIPLPARSLLPKGTGAQTTLKVRKSVWLSTLTVPSGSTSIRNKKHVTAKFHHLPSLDHTNEHQDENQSVGLFQFR
ncbi:hypothetical protein O181_014566 [Austropuccinia psidii MF-1]|uniref:Uncharacterized protein n=1 Tax=Austropuccinia psidii MF-1 TaxID=1389203 RepID=A0A9Q3GP92_9BASI|nr:hypothetical protein [Austropuccinia psidii MF-1]